MKPPPQYEDPDNATRLALWKMRTPQAMHPDSKVSGVRILNFAKGWAIRIIPHAGMAHWFVRSDDYTTSLCGIESHVDLMHGPGNYGRCQSCIKRMTGMIRRGETV